ncbi:hypothetical protein YPPY08_1378, partial [Yersinia pestis PY-08]|jgi:hypothetical protein
MQRL